MMPIHCSDNVLNMSVHFTVHLKMVKMVKSVLWIFYYKKIVHNGYSLWQWSLVVEYLVEKHKRSQELGNHRLKKSYGLHKFWMFPYSVFFFFFQPWGKEMHWIFYWHDQLLCKSFFFISLVYFFLSLSTYLSLKN